MTAWIPARAALDRAADAGRTVAVWLRDDDCVAVTSALDRLASICGAVGLPILLAVIPEPAESSLAGWIAARPSVAPCQHGFAHCNHADIGARARELGGHRPLADVCDDLARGRVKLRDLFGDRLVDIIVPPWNRIDPAVVPRLPGLGFTALSTFGPTPAADGSIRRIDCDLDIVDWRRGRIGRPLADLAPRVAEIVARQDRLGLLTHHLAHDATAWDSLGEMLGLLAEHPAVRFTSAGAILAR